MTQKGQMVRETGNSVLSIWLDDDDDDDDDDWLTLIYCIHKKFKCSCVPKCIVFYFLPLCSVIVYQVYTLANIGPWWMGTQLNIFLCIKQTNSCLIGEYRKL